MEFNSKGMMVAGGVALIAMISAVSPSKAAAQRFHSPMKVDTTVALGSNGTLSVSVYSGHVNVVGGSASGVHIRGTADRDNLEITGRASIVSVSSEIEDGSGGRADLDITVPIGTRVILEGFSAPFSVRGTKGEARLQTLSGKMTVSDAAGTVRVESVSGDIDIDNVDGSVHTEAVSATVTLDRISGDIDGASVNGAFAITRTGSRSVRLETVSGSIGYAGAFDPSGNYVFKSHAGRVTLGIPADAGATVTLQTFSGNVDSAFPVTLESGRSRAGHESRFEFRIGNGRTRIVAETFSGDIRIQRSTTSDNRE
jgi:DUF4097 and DUF4098 domain-containing protein YvlB